MDPPARVLTASSPCADQFEKKVAFATLKSLRPVGEKAVSVVAAGAAVKATKTRPSGDHGCDARTSSPRTATVSPWAPTIQSPPLDVHALSTKCELSGCHAA